MCNTYYVFDSFSQNDTSGAWHLMLLAVCFGSNVKAGIEGRGLHRNMFSRGPLPVFAMICATAFELFLLRYGQSAAATTFYSDQPHPPRLVN